MALRAVPPSEVQPYLKMLIYGGAGVGKSFNLTKIPRSYYFDLEQGASYPEYVKNLSDGESVIFSTVDIDEVIAEVTSLLSEKHSYRNVIIDPITTVFKDEADTQEKYVGTDYGKNTAEANKKWRRLGKLLKRLQMNVFVVAYEQVKFNDDSLVPNGPKDIAHFFDVVLHAQKRGNDRVAIVVKSRSSSFPEGLTMPFTFDELAARASVELARNAEPIKLASDEQVAELKRLLMMRVDGEKLTDKWLKKVGAEELSEMPADAAEKCLNYLRTASSDEKPEQPEKSEPKVARAAR